VRKSREEAAPKKLGEESVKKVKSVNKKVDGSKLKPL
jgi:nickel-dependent lactate racemase